jgi:hypothetical protein
MLLGIQVLTTGLIGEMITFKNFVRSDSTGQGAARLSPAPSFAA